MTGAGAGRNGAVAWNVLGNLQDYDLLDLLLTLAQGARGGLFEVHHPEGQFRLAVQDGQVGQASFGVVQGEAALARLIADPRGRFALRPVEVTAERPMLAFVLGALRLLPPLPQPLEGRVRWRDEVDLATLALLPSEREAVEGVRAGRPLAELARDPAVAAALARFARLGLLSPRQGRVARLTVGVWRDGGQAAALDRQLGLTWAQQLGGIPRSVQVRGGAGVAFRLSVQFAPRLGAHLLMAPELLVLYGLRVGEPVWVRPHEDRARRRGAP